MFLYIHFSSKKTKTHDKITDLITKKEHFTYNFI